LGTDLSESDLRRVNLQGAYLRETNLQGATLEEADLGGVGHLTVEQLSKVKTLYKVRLDSELKEEIKKDYPHLLGKPKSTDLM
jgi:uncharacterized protein YjbI with pentapeptide repeats